MKAIKNWLLKNLLNAITLKDVIIINPRGVYINNLRISEEEARVMKEEVKIIEATRVWTVIEGTLAEKAKDMIFNKSKTTDDILWGKAMLYNLDLINKIFATLKK